MEAVHTIDGVPIARIPVDGRGHRATGWWGMMFFIITEGTLFAYLLFSYFYVGAQNRTWPPGGPPELTLAIVNTVILVVSSIPMRLGTLAIRRASRGALAGWAIVTVLLGVAFLIIEATEWSRKPFRMSTSSYGSLYFTVTGFHFAHVVVGLLLILEIVWRALAGRVSAARPLAVETVGAYWHFVGVVWLFVFFTIYVSPHLW
jgi:cytochrome c oxidase subunit 3